MGKRMKKRILYTVALFLLFIAFTVVVKTVDVKAIGPQGSEVGLAGYNQQVRASAEKLVGYQDGYNKLLYVVTEIVGYLSLLSVAAFGLMGLMQLIRGGIKRVNYRLWIMGGFYVLVLFCYVLFEKVVVNYRPVMMDGELEASYPSSHTMLSVCCMGAALIHLPRFFRHHSKKVLEILTVLCWAVIVVMVLGRLLCGVHWFSDIVGGVLLSAALLMLHYTVFKYVRRRLTRPVMH